MVKFLSKNTLTIGLLSVILSMSNSISAQKLYRWINDDGRVIYSDRMPPEASRKARSELNNVGITQKLVKAAKSQQQIRLEKRLKALKEKHKKTREILAERDRRAKVRQKTADRALLHTFSSVRNIKKAHRGRISGINSIIKLSKHNLDQLKQQLVGLDKRIAIYLDRNQTIPDKLREDYDATQDQIDEREVYVVTKIKERKKIKAKLRDDIERYRFLTKRDDQIESKSSITLASKDAYSAPSLIGVVTCGRWIECGLAWDRAKGYVKKHSTTELKLMTETVILSAIAASNQDLSITVAKFPDGQGNAELVMEMQCKNSKTGQKLCSSKKVLDVKNKFEQIIRGSSAS